MAPPVKRHWYQFSRAYPITARRIASLAVPTLNDSFDNPPMCGPYRGRRDTNTFRAGWHRFLEALREGTLDPNDYNGRLYSILEELTTRSDPRLTVNGGQEWWIEFAPHPVVLDGWRQDPELFATAQRRHILYLKSIDTANTLA